VTTERRRQLVEELVEHRSAAVATLPVLEDEPPAHSLLWLAGALRLALAAGAARDVCDPALRRRRVRDLAVVAMAWFEAADRAFEDVFSEAE
jgi:hypothetical protein